MHSNNPNSDYTTPKTGVESVLSSLSIRNYQMARAYKDSVELLEGEDSQLRTYLQELANDHDRWESELNNLLTDLPGTPHTPSKQDNSLLDGRLEELQSAVKAKNHPQLYQLALQANQSLEQFYGECLSNDNLNESVVAAIKKQGEEILEQQRKLDRLKSVPV